MSCGPARGDTTDLRHTFRVEGRVEETSRVEETFEVEVPFGVEETFRREVPFRVEERVKETFKVKKGLHYGGLLHSGGGCG